MSRRLNVSRSEDGELRATLRVDHRIGIEELAGAAGYGLEHDLFYPELGWRETLPKLHREDLLYALRIAYHEYGEIGALVNGRNLPDESAFRRASIARARELFPEFEDRP